MGADDKHISSIDTGGVALAAIQGLYEIIKEKDAEMAAMKKHNEKLEARLTVIESMLVNLSQSK